MNLSTERIKKAAIFSMVVGFVVGLIFNFGGMAVDKIRGFWRPLFEQTGLDTKFANDPTGSVEAIVAILMTAVGLFIVGYILTMPTVWGWMRNIFVIAGLAGKEVSDEEKREMERQMKGLKDETKLRALQPVLVPHNGSLQECAKIKETHGKSVFLVAGYLLFFVQGPQPARIHVNGESSMMMFLRAFKPAWPFWYPIEPTLLNPEAGVLKIEGADFAEVKRWFTSGGFSEIECLDIRPWNEKEK